MFVIHLNFFDYKRANRLLRIAFPAILLTKMEVLKVPKKFGELIGLCLREDAARKESAISYLVNVVFVFSLLLYSGGSVALIVMSYPDDMAVVSFCILECTATIALLCPYFVSVQQKFALMHLFNDIKTLVWQCEVCIQMNLWTFDLLFVSSFSFNWPQFDCKVCEDRTNCQLDCKMAIFGEFLLTVRHSTIFVHFLRNQWPDAGRVQS